MKLKLTLLLIIAITAASISSCSRNIENTPPAVISNEISTVKDDPPISVTYISYEDHYRFISKSAPLLWMPDDSSPKVCDLTNTLVEVMFAGYTTEDNVWLFVTYRTYDTPTNNRGWIRESKADKYNKENQKLVKDIIIPKGTLGADKNETDKSTIDEPGLIEKQEDDKVLIMFAGGKEVWYYEKDIKYPPLD